MKIYIVEDEPLAAAHLAKVITGLEPAAQILGTADNVRDAVQWLSQHTPDVIFMDIQLGDALSFDIFSQVKITSPVIFTTAYDQYAIRAFQANGIGYLLKPIGHTEMGQMLQRLRELRSHFGYSADLLEGLMREIRKPVYRERFMVTAGSKLRSVSIDDVAWFVSEGRYVKIITRDNHRYLIDDTLEKLDETIDPSRFFRINRKFIVSFESIAGMTPWSKSRVKLDLNPAAEEDVVVSVERSADFKNWLDQ